MRDFGGMGRMAAVAAALASAAPALAEPCWSAAEADAAKVRELQSMLMVAALRCRAEGNDILADYDALIRAERPALAAANARLRDHFATAGAGGEEGYDRFTTALANGYGDGGAREIGCNTAIGLMRDAAAVPDAAALLRVASASIAARPLPGGVCAQPAEPVTLAPEVVAALETLARFPRSQPSAPVPAPTQIASRAP